MAALSIAVCVKPVPEGPAAIDPATLSLDRAGGQVKNEPDLHAVEAAIRLRESGGGDVTVVSMGGGDALAWLRTPLAMGADRAVVVSDAAVDGSDLLATSRVLSALLARERLAIVLFGQEATDSNGAVLFAAIANRLRLPLASRVVAIEPVAGTLVVRRRAESALETLELPLPCAVAVSSGVAEPRVPSFRRLKAAGGEASRGRLARGPRARRRTRGPGGIEDGRTAAGRSCASTAGGENRRLG